MSTPEWTGEPILFLTCVAILAFGVTAWAKAKIRERRLEEREFECLAKELNLEEGLKRVDENARYLRARELRLNAQLRELQTLRKHVDTRSQIPFWMDTPGQVKKSDFVLVGEKK